MSKKKVLKRTGILFISSILVLFVAWQLLKELKIKAFVVDSLQTELNIYFEDSVQLQINDIAFNVFEKEMLLNDIAVNLVAAEQDTLATLELQSLNFSWNNHWESFRNQFFKFRLLELKKAKLFLPIDFKKIKKKKATRPSFDGQFELLIQEFSIRDAEILFYDKQNRRSGRIKAQYNLSAQNLHFRKGEIPASFEDVADKIFLEFHDLTYFLKDELHKIEVKKISFDLFQQSLTVNSAHFRPIHSPKKFAQLKGEEANHIDILMDSIQINSISWKGDSMISAHSVFSKNINLKVEKDKNYLLPEDRFVPILVEKLKQSTMAIDIRECTIKKMFINYYEIPKGKSEKGRVRISDIDAEITNITNRKDSMTKYGNYLLIKAQGNLYDEGKLQADIRYDLKSRYGYFKVAGNLQPMRIDHINQYLANSYPVEITSGRVDELYFNYSGGNRAVSGEMEFKYSNLKIRFHKIINEDEKGDKALSWLANVALSQQNPRKNGRFRVGKIQYERDTRKSMFSYWSSSLTSGFQSTLGMNKPARFEKLKQKKDERKFWQKLGIGKEDRSE